MSSLNHAEIRTVSKPMLDEICTQHTLWLQSEGKEGRRANLAGQNLSGYALNGLFLSDANFRGAILTGVDFSASNLQGVDFSEAELTQVNFRGASLDGANMARSIARHAYLDEVSAIAANISYCMLEGASATGADFTGANFRDSLITKSDFAASIMVQANLRYCSAAECRFDGVNLSQADCRNAVFDRTRFVNAQLNGAQMRNASFEQVTFTDTDFSQTIDLEPQYQSDSFAHEKLSIRKELENLGQKRDEVRHFESNIKQQRVQIAQQRKILASLNELENDVSDQLLEQMHWCRRIAMFWFMVVAVLAVVAVGKLSQLNIAQLSAFELSAIIAGIGAVLGTHILSAGLSFNMAKRFASYVRERSEKLAKVDVSGAENERADASATPSPVAHDVTYL